MSLPLHPVYRRLLRRRSSHLACNRDRDQPQNSEHDAVVSPRNIIDHEAAAGIGEIASALPDPNESDQNGDSAGRQQSSSHRALLVLATTLEQPGYQSPAHHTFVFRIAWKVSREEILFVQQPPDEHGQKAKDSEQSVPGIERERQPDDQ